MRVPAECRTVIIDTPAAIDAHLLPDLTRGADAVLVPVMPSEIDIHATAKCIADLLLVAKIRRSEKRIAIVANRVRNNTRVSQSLLRFLESLDIPLVATLRDTQNYVRSAEIGLGVYEMPRWQTQQDFVHWQQLLAWLAARRRETKSAVRTTKVVAIERSGPEVARIDSGSGLASAAGRD
jgi:chromosome partitioning protein